MNPQRIERPGRDLYVDPANPFESLEPFNAVVLPGPTLLMDHMRYWRQHSTSPDELTAELAPRVLEELEYVAIDRVALDRQIKLGSIDLNLLKKWTPQGAGMLSSSLILRHVVDGYCREDYVQEPDLVVHVNRNAPQENRLFIRPHELISLTNIEAPATSAAWHDLGSLVTKTVFPANVPGAFSANYYKATGQQFDPDEFVSVQPFIKRDTWNGALR